MLVLSTNVAAAMRRQPLSSFLMVRIKDDTTVFVNSTTLSHDITMSNGWTYLSDGRVVAADPPKQSTNVDREQYKLSFADPLFLMGALTNWIGKDVDVRLGFYDVNGAAYTNIQDTLIVYGGNIDGAGYKVEAAGQGEALFQLTCASPMADLDLIKSIYLSRDTIRGRNIKDTSCDMIYSGSSTISLKWGKT